MDVCLAGDMTRSQQTVQAIASSLTCHTLSLSLIMEASAVEAAGFKVSYDFCLR